MPVVTNARTGWLEGTGVAAREKLRTPAATIATPIRIRPPPAVQEIADEMVPWDQRQLVDAVKRQARHEETTRFDTIEFKLD